MTRRFRELDEPETLEHGRPLREPGRPRRTHTPARAWLPARVLAAALVGGALVAVPADLALRERELGRVEACRAAGEAAVRAAASSELGTVLSVQPALRRSSAPAVRTRLLARISDRARPTLPAVRRARDRCSDTGVLWFHQSLRTARDECLGLLEAELAHLREVTSNGAVAFVTRDRVGGCG